MCRRWGVCQKGRSHGFFKRGRQAVRYHEGNPLPCQLLQAVFRRQYMHTTNQTNAISSTTTHCEADWTMLPMKMADYLSIGTQMYSLFYYNSCDSDWLKNAPRSQPYSSVTHGWLHDVFHGLVAQDRQPHLRRATLRQTKRVCSKSAVSLVSIA